MKLMHRKMSRVMERCSRWVKSGCMRRQPTGMVAPLSALSCRLLSAGECLLSAMIQAICARAWSPSKGIHSGCVGEERSGVHAGVAHRVLTVDT